LNFEETFERYLAETKLRRSSETLKEVRDKLFCIQRLKDLFSQLEDFIIEEGFLDMEDEEPIFFDFVVRREEIKFGIFIEVTQPCPMITLERLNALNKKLNKDPALDAVIIVWNDDGLSTCALDSLTLKTYFGRTDPVIRLSGERQGNFVEIVRDFYNQQFVNWVMPSEVQFPETFDLRGPRIMELVENNVFREFQEQIESRTFRINEKKEARNKITVENVKRIANFLGGIVKKEEISTIDLKALKDFYNAISEED